MRFVIIICYSIAACINKRFCPVAVSTLVFYFKRFEILINNILTWTETNHLRYLLEKKTANRISKIEGSCVFLRVNEAFVLCPCALYPGLYLLIKCPEQFTAGTFYVLVRRFVYTDRAILIAYSLRTAGIILKLCRLKPDPQPRWALLTP